MSTLVAIDPSLTRLGFAVFERGELVRTGVVRGKTKASEDIVHRVTHIAHRTMYEIGARLSIQDMVFEWPQLYGTGKSKGSPNKLMPLAAVCSAIGSIVSLRGARLHSYLPSEWAGQVPKCTTVAGCKSSPRALRILSRLSVEEQSVWNEAKYDDEIDAIGIGLKFLGRYERKRA